ncbi:hypothetical protein [Halosegnis sp.]|uniref:hypothetical protein n=1 Tax=Halosegnis sp. TaxID=2864959 RepID=UPI0035D526F8
MYDSLLAVNRRLSERQKVLGGAVGILAGTVLIGFMTFGNVPSIAMQVVLGVVGVLFAVVGTLLLGTSEQREQTV